MTRFLNVPEGRTCRFDNKITPAEIEGLYTDSFSVCNIVIFYKQSGDSLRISMTHADHLITFEHIQKEKLWIGDDAEQFVVAKNIEGSAYNRQKLLGNLLTSFEVINCDSTNFALTSGKEKLYFYTRETVPALATHPFEWRLHNIYMLNIIFKQPNKKLENSILLYDVNHWCDLMRNDQELSQAARLFYSQFIAMLPQFNFPSKLAADQTTENILTANQIRIDQNIKIQIAWCSLLLFTKNDYQAIYNAQLEHVLLLNEHMTKTQLELIKKIYSSTKTNFEQFQRFCDELHQLPSTIASTLRGIYKLCRRAKQHTYPLVNSLNSTLPSELSEERQTSLLIPGLFGRRNVPWCDPPPGSVIDKHGCTVLPHP